MSVFVVVHGAWGSPDEMEPVRAPLVAAGHEMIAVDLPCTNPNATLADYATVIHDAIPADRGDVILVGHSFGGFSITTVAMSHSGLSLVYVAALVPQPGSSLVDLFVGHDPFVDEPDVNSALAAFGGLVIAAEAGTCALDIDALVSDVARDDQAATREYLQGTQRSQGIAAMREKWNGSLPADRCITYVLTTADTLVDPDDQRAMAESIDATVVELESDHSAFGEKPERLADILIASATD